MGNFHHQTPPTKIQGPPDWVVRELSRQPLRLKVKKSSRIRSFWESDSRTADVGSSERPFGVYLPRTGEKKRSVKTTREIHALSKFQFQHSSWSIYITIWLAIFHASFTHGDSADALETGFWGQSSQRVREIPSMKLPEPKLWKVIAHGSKFKNNKNKPNNLCNCFHLKPLRDHAGSFNLILSDALEDLCLDLWIGSFRRSSDSQVGVPPVPAFCYKKSGQQISPQTTNTKWRNWGHIFFLWGGETIRTSLSRSWIFGDFEGATGHASCGISSPSLMPRLLLMKSWCEHNESTGNVWWKHVAQGWNVWNMSRLIFQTSF